MKPIVVVNLSLMAVVLFAACASSQTPTYPASTATANAICQAWRDALVRPSALSDTEGTLNQIHLEYEVHAAACPEHAWPAVIE